MMRRLRLIENAEPLDRPSVPLDGKEGGIMKVAFATSDMKNVNAHFGGAKQLAVYEVTAEDSRFLEALQFDNISAEDGDHDQSEDRLFAKIEGLKGCQLLFVLAIGGPAAARVVNNKVHPIKLSGPESIPDVIARVQGMLKGSPPPWLRKVLQDDSRKMDFLEEEDA